MIPDGRNMATYSACVCVWDNLTDKVIAVCVCVCVMPLKKVFCKEEYKLLDLYKAAS